MASFSALLCSSHLTIVNTKEKGDLLYKLWFQQFHDRLTWLVLHGKILTADRLAFRGWPHDPICQLCLHALEMSCHLCKDCPFTSKVWSTVHGWSADVCPSALSSGTHASVNDWWDAMLAGADTKTKRSRSGRCFTSFRTSGKSGTEESFRECASHIWRWPTSRMRTFGNVLWLSVLPRQLWHQMIE
jgi:hypothetical protein